MVISLIGLTGTGKSTIGRRLAARLHLPYVDLDEAIVLRAGKSIPDIFAVEGEAGFRNIEAEVLWAECLSKSDKVLSTGGGIVLREENRKRIMLAGPVVWLDAPLEVIAGRVSGDDNRPLTHGADPLRKVREMDQERRELYKQCAGFVVNTLESGVDETVEAIMTYLSESGHV